MGNVKEYERKRSEKKQLLIKSHPYISQIQLNASISGQKKPTKKDIQIQELLKNDVTPTMKRELSNNLICFSMASVYKTVNTENTYKCRKISHQWDQFKLEAIYWLKIYDLYLCLNRLKAKILFKSWLILFHVTAPM